VTGHLELDAQHRGILEEAERIRSAPLHAVWASVEFLAWHTAAHFAFEERLMEELAYPARQAHGEEHAQFLARLTTRRAGLEHGGATPENVRALSGLVEEWVTMHVKASDVALAAFVLAARGGQAVGRP
jgi:hemerythrin